MPQESTSEPVPIPIRENPAPSATAVEVKGWLDKDAEGRWVFLVPSPDGWLGVEVSK